MVKKTLIAIALALLVTTAYAGNIEVTNLDAGDDAAVKVEGKEEWKKTFHWPYEVSWKYLEQDICTIPVKMEVGMYIEIIECNKKEIVLEQVSCGDIGQEAKKYPCYKKCITVDAVANFNAQLGLKKCRIGPIIASDDDWKAYFDGGSTVDDTGDVNTLTICVEAWKARIYKEKPGEKVDVGEITITVKPTG